MEISEVLGKNSKFISQPKGSYSALSSAFYAVIGRLSQINFWVRTSELLKL